MDRYHEVDEKTMRALAETSAHVVGADLAEYVSPGEVCGRNVRKSESALLRTEWAVIL
jgi:hypothetical protein